MKLGTKDFLSLRKEKWEMIKIRCTITSLFDPLFLKNTLFALSFHSVQKYGLDWI